MSTMLLTLIIIAIMPYIAKVPLVWAMQHAGGYNNHYPRQQQAILSQFGQRCTAAHYNSFEALLFYAVAILCVASASEVTQIMQYAAWLFVACRIGYLVCYWYDWATARSLVWLLSMAAAISIMLMALTSLD